MPPTVAAIIPEYDESSRSIDRTLRAILNQAAAPDSVIVVDDASPSGPPQIEPDLAQRVMSVSLNRNSGVSTARNRGAAITQADYLLFTNCDVELAPGWIERAAAFMDASPQCGAASGRIIPLYGRRTLREWRLQHIETKVHRSAVSQPTQVTWLVGHVLFVRRTAFEAIDGFDPGYRRAGDDPDLCQRLTAAGWQNYHLPELSAMSHERASIESLARKSVRNTGWNLRAECEPCKAVKPLRPLPASVATLRKLIVRLGRDLVRGRPRFVPVDFAVAAESLRLIWLASLRPGALNS